MRSARLTEEEFEAFEAARCFFNHMARMIHRAKMKRRGIGSGVELKEALALGPVMEAHRVAVVGSDKGDPLSDDYRGDSNQLAVMLSTDLLSAWSCLLSEINGGSAYPRPQLKTTRMYDMPRDGRGWTYRRLTPAEIG